MRRQQRGGDAAPSLGRMRVATARPAPIPRTRQGRPRRRRRRKPRPPRPRPWRCSGSASPRPRRTARTRGCRRAPRPRHGGRPGRTPGARAGIPDRALRWRAAGATPLAAGPSRSRRRRGRGAAGRRGCGGAERGGGRVRAEPAGVDNLVPAERHRERDEGCREEDVRGSRRRAVSGARPCAGAYVFARNVARRRTARVVIRRAVMLLFCAPDTAKPIQVGRRMWRWTLQEFLRTPGHQLFILVTRSSTRSPTTT